MTIRITQNTEINRPVYCRYEGQTAPQPAFICLTEDGEVYADYTGLIGMSPVSVWNYVDLWYYINPELSKQDIDDLIDDIELLLERVHAGHTVEWDGSNYVGKLNDDAREAGNEIGRICESWEPTEYQDFEYCEHCDNLLHECIC